MMQDHKDNQNSLSGSFQSFFNSDKEALLAKAIATVFVNEAVRKQYGGVCIP